jgi:hypothetical protein
MNTMAKQQQQPQRHVPPPLEKSPVEAPKPVTVEKVEPPAPTVIKPGVEGVYAQRPAGVTDKGIDFTTKEGRQQIDDLLKKQPQPSPLVITWGFFLRGDGPGTRPLVQIAAKGDAPRRYDIVELSKQKYIIMDIETTQTTATNYFVKMTVELYSEAKHKQYVELRY